MAITFAKYFNPTACCVTSGLIVSVFVSGAHQWSQLCRFSYVQAAVEITGPKSDVHGSVHRKPILKYNWRDATLHNLFISVKFSTCFRRFLRPSSGAQKLYIEHRVLCQTFTATCHCRGRDGTGSISSTTVAGSNKGLKKYPMLYIQFLSSWWWAEERPETCREFHRNN
jgi:hypothetical protein